MRVVQNGKGPVSRDSELRQQRDEAARAAGSASITRKGRRGRETAGCAVDEHERQLVQRWLLQGLEEEGARKVKKGDRAAVWGGAREG